MYNPTAKYLSNRNGAHAHQKASARMFITVVATVTGDWEKPKCPSAVGKTKGKGILGNRDEVYNTDIMDLTKMC